MPYDENLGDRRKAQLPNIFGRLEKRDMCIVTGQDESKNITLTDDAGVVSVDSTSALFPCRQVRGGSYHPDELLNET